LVTGNQLASWNEHQQHKNQTQFSVEHEKFHFDIGAKDEMHLSLQIDLHFTRHRLLKIYGHPMLARRALRVPQATFRGWRRGRFSRWRF
jgi:hypothetical protein